MRLFDGVVVVVIVVGDVSAAIADVDNVSSLMCATFIWQ